MKQGIKALGSFINLKHSDGLTDLWSNKWGGVLSGSWNTPLWNSCSSPCQRLRLGCHRNCNDRWFSLFIPTYIYKDQKIFYWNRWNTWIGYGRRRLLSLLFINNPCQEQVVKIVMCLLHDWVIVYAFNPRTTEND